MKLAIVGSRYLTDYEFFSTKVDEYIGNEKTPVVDCIISGGARGADTMAARYAHEHNINFLCFTADWTRYGKAAGHIRNSQMIDVADAVLAFPLEDSRGTYDTVRKAKEKGIQVVIHKKDELPLWSVHSRE